MAKKGRPTKYTKELGAEICAMIADNKSLRTICLSDDMPAPTTVYQWIAKYPDFSNQYAKAHDDQADVIYEDIGAIEQDLRNGIIDAPTARVLIDSHKWRAGKMRPKKYGSQHTVDHNIGVEDKLKELLVKNSK